jgi:prophage maintenance system killer protein
MGRADRTKEGRERYGFDDTTQTQFIRCIDEANAVETVIAARAVRAYLDILFYHPFVDGNSRIAALTLEFLLSRHGIRLDQVGPLFMITRRADDLAGVHSFVRLLDVLIEATQRHARDHAI